MVAEIIIIVVLLGIAIVVFYIRKEVDTAKKRYLYNFNTNRYNEWKYTYDDAFVFDGNRIHVSKIKMFSGSDIAIGGKFHLYCKDGRQFSLCVEVKDFSKIHKLEQKLRDKGINEKFLSPETPYDSGFSSKIRDIGAPREEKDASVVGRAVAGGIIAGPVGAVVGALSAVDKNNKNRENKKN